MRITNGLTVKDLKNIIQNWPDCDQYGEDFEIWIDNNDGTSSVCTGVYRLNQNDILLSAK